MAINNVKEIKTYEDLVKFYKPNMILNNEIANHFNFEIINGLDGLYDEETGEYAEIFQTFIIDGHFADILEHICIDEVILYNEELNMYLWGILHFGTDWEYVPVETIYNTK